ncbi:hypothetical protein L0Z72_00880, partial [candidate division KSB1 bacterium]|nr:hypothetical protein [candidate division KSB1 bacterium]
RKYYASLKEKQGSDLANDLFDKMGRLSFEKLSKFQLIAEDYPSASVFITEDQQAEDIWDNFIQIHEMKPSFEKRKQFLKLKPHLMQYIISIPRNLISGNWQMFGGFYCVPYEGLSIYYQDDIGFYPADEKQITALIF